MKNPVLDMRDFIGWLQQSRANFAKELAGTLTPEQIKEKSASAVAGKSGKSLLAFKEVMDSLKKESYINGQLSIFDHMIQMAEEQVKKFEEKYLCTDGKEHAYTMSADSFEKPYCSNCLKDS